MPNHLPPDVVTACVVAAAVDTHYLAAGRGAPVVLLSVSQSLREALLRQMPRAVRVIAPVLNGGEDYCATVALFSVWLVNFLDALGVHRVPILADAALAARARQFSEHCDDRVSQLILLNNDPSAAEPMADMNQPGAHTARLQFEFSDDQQLIQPAELTQLVQCLAGAADQLCRARP